MRKWAIWIPVLMVAALLYWTVALGLGGLSLMVFGSLSDCDGTDMAEVDSAQIKDSYEPITVNLVEASEVGDAQVAPMGTGAGPGDNGARLYPADQGPGATAF